MSGLILGMTVDEFERQMLRLFDDIKSLPHEVDRLYVMRELNSSFNRVSKELSTELDTLDAPPDAKDRVRKILRDMIVSTARNIAQIDDRISKKSN